MVNPHIKQLVIATAFLVSNKGLADQLFEDRLIEACYGEGLSGECRRSPDSCLYTTPVIPRLVTSEICKLALSGAVFAEQLDQIDYENDQRKRFFEEISDRTKNGVIFSENDTKAIVSEFPMLNPLNSRGELIRFFINNVIDQDILADFYADSKILAIRSAQNSFNISLCFLNAKTSVIEDKDFLEGETFSFYDFIDKKVLETKFILSKFSKLAIEGILRSDEKKLTKNEASFIRSLLKADAAVRGQLTSDCRGVAADETKDAPVSLCRASRSTHQQEGEVKNTTTQETPEIVQGVKNDLGSIGGWIWGDEEKAQSSDGEDSSNKPQGKEQAWKNTSPSLLCSGDRRKNYSNNKFSNTLLTGDCQIGDDNSGHNVVELSGSLPDILKVKDILGAITIDSKTRMSEIKTRGYSAGGEDCRYSSVGFSNIGLVISLLSSERDRIAMSEAAIGNATKIYNGMRKIDAANENYSTKVYEAYSKKISIRRQQDDAERLRKSVNE